MDDIEKIFISSSKAELIEWLTEALVNTDKAIIVLIEDMENGKYTSHVTTLGLVTTYEAYGILEVARQDLQGEDY